MRRPRFRMGRTKVQGVGLGPASRFEAVYTVDPHEAVALLLEGGHVAVPGSAEARVILICLGLTEADIDMKLRVARYGVYEVLDP